MRAELRGQDAERFIEKVNAVGCWLGHDAQAAWEYADGCWNVEGYAANLLNRDVEDLLG